MTTGSTPPPRKGERTKLKILRALAQLFASQPPDTVKMEDIAYAAGVSIGTLYNYFPGKAALLLALSTDAYEVLDTYRAEAAAHASALERVYAAGEAYLRFAIERPAFVRFMMTRGLQGGDDPDLRQLAQGTSGRVNDLVRQAQADLEEAMRVGEVPPGPVDEIVVMLFGVWNGIAGLVVRADQTAMPPELAWRALNRARGMLDRAIAHEFASPEPAPLPWEAHRT